MRPGMIGVIRTLPERDPNGVGTRFHLRQPGRTDDENGGVFDVPLRAIPAQDTSRQRPPQLEVPFCKHLEEGEGFNPSNEPHNLHIFLIRHDASHSAFIGVMGRVRAGAPVLDGIVLKMLLRRYSWFGEPGFNQPNCALGELNQNRALDPITSEKPLWIIRFTVRLWRSACCLCVSWE